MVSMWMPTELTGCQWVITEHNIGSMGYHQDVENTILRNQEDWKREHGFLPEEVRPEHPKWYLYPETINSYYDTNKTKEWNYQEYQKQLKKAQDEWWAGVKENKEPQFTPWQEIEVSNDGEKWYKYRFSMMSWTAPTIYIVNVDTENWQYACSYRFARPIEDKIELLPPHEFSYDSQTEFEMIVMQRLELLTIALNKLIAKQ